MTLRSRNSMVLAFFSLLCLAFIAFILLLLRLDLTSVYVVRNLELGRGYYLGFEWQLSRQMPMINIASTGISLLFGLMVAFIFLKNFRKISSPQLFFLLLFWLSLSIEIVRILHIYQLQIDAPLVQRMFLSRIEIMGQVFGCLSLFAASLYTAGIKLQHQETILVAMVIISSSMAYLIPVDNSRIGQELMFIPSKGFSLDAFRLITGLLTILNFIKYSVVSKDLLEFLMVPPVFLLIIGQEMIYASTEWVTLIAAWVLLIIGTIWITRRFINNYMWY